MVYQNNAHKESVIVFGANGFLGSVVTRKLHESGFKVHAVIRPEADTSRLCSLKDLNISKIKPENWPQLVVSNAPETVICAQWEGVSKQDRDNLELQMTNIEPILNIAIAAKESRVNSFICFGSQAEAKESIEIVKEEFYVSGESAYGGVKAKLHAQLMSMLENSDCRFVWARVFSVYGPSDFSDSLLMRLFKSEIKQKELFISNPSKFWSYLYEDDFASAVEEIVKNSNIASTINVGSPVFNEIREIVAIWQGHSLNDHRSYQPSQANVGFFPRLEKLQSIGWNPTVSLVEGIQRTRKAFQDRANSK
jgi:UDP-glucose 4-epimerase